MATRENIRSVFDIFITIFIIGIVTASLILSGAAVFENMRFSRATDQILEPVSLMRGITAQQPSYVEVPGDDVWAALVRLGRIPSGTSHANPWGSELRAIGNSGDSIRIESDLPTHDCRRMALYFMGQAQGFGITTIEAQPYGASIWSPVYPVPAEDAHKDVTDMACGNAAAARLAIIFKIK